MVKPIPVPAKGKIAIKYKDVFHFEELYKGMHWWLEDNDWQPGAHEDLYLEKHADGAMEHIIRWNVKKIPDGSKYYSFSMFIDFHTLGIKANDVVVEGKKLPAVKGEIQIEISPLLHLDMKGQFSKHPFLSGLHARYYKNFFKKEIEQKKNELYEEVFEFHGSIKKFLHLKQWIGGTEQEPFHPARAFPS